MSMKKLILLLVCGLTVLPILAQKTYYYKMVKKNVKGVESTNVSGGQFVTFYPHMCFESTRDGYGIGHETLKLVSKSNQETVYKGKSYWDNATIFKFMNNYSKLLVITQTGDQYGYVYSTAPSEASTCSLIRKNNPSLSSSGNAGGGYVSIPTQGVVSTSSSQSIQKTKCMVCGGTGQTINEVYVGSSGTKKWCPTCRTYVYTGHSHGTCRSCLGSGYVR